MPEINTFTASIAAAAFVVGGLVGGYTHARLIRAKLRMLESIAAMTDQRLRLNRKQRRAYDAKVQRAFKKQPYQKAS